ncbi:uncharacterized protein LOC108150793 [Drosophila miranda]|uniref:uncharacterized protein LOC108150793 n=1 Tax=Drosophila miranda TaxID=7229 RepID=UPI0007E764CA|nr:uncharacterized protein LOC108150793 [Drosophila miranda]
MWLSLCTKVVFSGAQQKLQKKQNERRNNRQLRTAEAKSSFPLSSINAVKIDTLKTKNGLLEVFHECVETRQNDSIINLTNPSMIQLMEAVQAANITGQRIILSGKDCTADDSKTQMAKPEANVAQSLFKANMRRFMETEHSQKPDTEAQFYSFSAAARDLMCRSVSANDVHNEHSRSYNTPELSVMRVRSEDRLFSICEVDSDNSDSDCESLTQSERYLFDTETSKAATAMVLERPSTMISSAKNLTVSINGLEGNPPQNALLCNMIHLAHLAFVIACLRGLL